MHDGFLTYDTMADYEMILVENMEPTFMSDILFCYGVLSLVEYVKFASDRSSRKKRAKILIKKTRAQQENASVFCHALEFSRCSYFEIEYIKNSLNNSLPPFRSEFEFSSTIKI